MQEGILHVSEDNSTLVRFTTSASRALKPDTIRVRLEVTQRGATPAAAQSALNSRIRAAVDTAKAVAGIKVTISSPHTYEDWQNGGVSNKFAAQQSLALTTGDFDAALALAANLQASEPSLRLQEVTFSLSNEARNALNAELLKEAVAQADTIATTMRDAAGAASLTAIELSPNLDGNGRFGGARAMAASLESTSAPVAEPEDLEVTVLLTAVYRLLK
jgi:predicted secreted protein